MHQLLLTEALPRTLSALGEPKQTDTCNHCARFASSSLFPRIRLLPVASSFVITRFRCIQVCSMRHAEYPRSKHQPTTHACPIDKTWHKYPLGLQNIISQPNTLSLSFVMSFPFAFLAFSLLLSPCLSFHAFPFCVFSFRCFLFLYTLYINQSLRHRSRTTGTCARAPPKVPPTTIGQHPIQAPMVKQPIFADFASDPTLTVDDDTLMDEFINFGAREDPHDSDEDADGSVIRTCQTAICRGRF